MPIRHQSGRSDISSARGRTSPGSCPSTMEAPPSNQDGLHRIQMIQRTQEVFGRTLGQVKQAVSLFERYAKGGENGSLKAWATNTLPALRHHLEMAQALV